MRNNTILKIYPIVTSTCTIPQTLSYLVWFALLWMTSNSLNGCFNLIWWDWMGWDGIGWDFIWFYFFLILFDGMGFIKFIKCRPGWLSWSCDWSCDQMLDSYWCCNWWQTNWLTNGIGEIVKTLVGLIRWRKMRRGRRRRIARIFWFSTFVECWRTSQAQQVQWCSLLV